MRNKSKSMEDKELTNEAQAAEETENSDINKPHSDDVVDADVREMDDSLDPSEEPEEESLEEQVKRLQTEAEEYLDGWQRARAEFANFKKRTQRENENARERIAGEIITHFLGVQDDIERALSRAPEADDFKEWILGIELIHHKLQALLDAEGVEPIEAEGERFDPTLHEAVSFEESEDHEEGLVIEITQRGYMLGERVLRPSMVRVAK
ncbi:MAG TPA: nucleotide exchange factor GrpE [Anaerolineales bacterium]|nr:nucleotide exchange factor GrpE [Anaerolineales bacterium]